MSADSYADLLERLFHDYEDLYPLTNIEHVAQQCRADLAGQTPPGAQLELLERLTRHRLNHPLTNSGPAATAQADTAGTRA